MPRPSACASLDIVVPAEPETVEDRHEEQRLADIEGQGHPPDRRQQPQQRLRGRLIELDEEDQLDGHQRDRNPSREHPVERLPGGSGRAFGRDRRGSARALASIRATAKAAAATSTMRRGFTKASGRSKKPIRPRNRPIRNRPMICDDPPGSRDRRTIWRGDRRRYWHGPARRTSRRRPRRGSRRS